MSLPIKPGALAPFSSDSLSEKLKQYRGIFDESLRNAQQIAYETMWIPSSLDEYDPAYFREADREMEMMEADREMEMMARSLEMEIRARFLEIERMGRERKMYQYASAYPNQDMGTGKREETSVSSGPSIAPEPSPSSTVQSSLSGASLLTSFLSTTSAENSGSSQSGSRSGPLKLLSSPSKAIAMKSSTPESKRS